MCLGGGDTHSRVGGGCYLVVGSYCRMTVVVCSCCRSCVMFGSHVGCGVVDSHHLVEGLMVVGSYWMVDNSCWRVADSCWRVSDSYWKVVDNYWRVAGNYWRAADNYWRAADNYWRVDNSYWRIAGSCWRVADNYWKVVGSYWRAGIDLEDISFLPKCQEDLGEI